MTNQRRTLVPPMRGVHTQRVPSEPIYALFKGSSPNESYVNVQWELSVEHYECTHLNDYFELKKLHGAPREIYNINKIY